MSNLHYDEQERTTAGSLMTGRTVGEDSCIARLVSDLGSFFFPGGRKDVELAQVFHRGLAKLALHLRNGMDREAHLVLLRTRGLRLGCSI